MPTDGGLQLGQLRLGFHQQLFDISQPLVGIIINALLLTLALQSRLLAQLLGFLTHPLGFGVGLLLKLLGFLANLLSFRDSLLTQLVILLLDLLADLLPFLAQLLDFPPGLLGLGFDLLLQLLAQLGRFPLCFLEHAGAGNQLLPLLLAPGHNRLGLLLGLGHQLLALQQQIPGQLQLARQGLTDFIQQLGHFAFAHHHPTAERNLAAVEDGSFQFLEQVQKFRADGFRSHRQAPGNSASG